MIEPRYQLGVGKADITGPVAGLRFFGYGDLGQVGCGIDQRLFARAFIVRRAPAPAPAGRSLVWVVCDLGMISELVRAEVLSLLRERLGDVYAPEAVCLSATHTHSAPGGYSAYFLYNASIGGHCPQNLRIIVQGIVQAIEQAHGSLQPGSLDLWAGSLDDAGINRSLRAHLRNPERERQAYAHGFDAEMVQLGFRGPDGTLRGLLNWFGVHGTSHDKDNRLVSPDNKGYAAWLVEQHFGPGFVAGFAQAGHGDVSPNRRATPDGRLVGEGASGRESLELIGRRQAECSIALTSTAALEIEGELGARLCHVDFSAAVVPAELSSTGRPTRTASPAVGQDFMAGTEDGRGPAWFGEGDDRDELLGKLADVIWSMDEEAPRLHAPKDVLISLASDERQWVPSVLPVQLLAFGELCVVALPFELTTMAARRLARLAMERLRARGTARVVAASVSNAYAGYLATPEEYDAQHYEGASTLFGREQLGAASHVVAQLSRALVDGTELVSAPTPDGSRVPRFGREIDLGSTDSTLGLAWFGDVVEDCEESYSPGNTAQATFWSSNPANELLPSYFDVERLDGDEWRLVATDHDWSTELRYRSWLGWVWKCTCAWRIEADRPPATYRLVHRGTRRSRDGQLARFQGSSRPFHVLGAEPFDVAGAPEPGDGALSHLPVADLEATPAFVPRTVETGTLLIREGEPARTLFYVRSGRLAVSRCLAGHDGGGGEDIDLDYVRPGQFVGEIGLLTGEPRSATVRALERSELLALDVEGYESLRSSHNPLADEIERRALSLLATRLRRLDFIISQIAEGGRSPYHKPQPSVLARLRALWSSGERTAPLAPRPLDPVALMKQSSLFAGVPSAELTQIAGWFEQRSVPAGHFLCTQGQLEGELYVLALGSVDVFVAVAGDGDQDLVHNLGRLGPGSAFGLAAFVDGRARSASCVACEQVDVLCMGRDRWQQACALSSRAASALRCAIARALAHQLADSGRRLLDLGWSGLVDPADAARLELSGEVAKATSSAAPDL